MTSKTNGRLPDLDALGLGDVCQPGTASYHAAQLLVAGQPITKKEIEAQTGVVGPTVARIMNKLEAHGVEIKKEKVHPSSKELLYRVKALPEHEAPEPEPETAMTTPTSLDVTIAEITATGLIHATLDTPVGRVSGVLNKLHLTSGDLKVTSVRFKHGGAQDWVIKSGEVELLLSDVRFL